jgi:membrane-associated phospholipid phosphatase
MIESLQLPWIQAIQEHTPYFLGQILLFCKIFDSTPFYILLIAFVWFGMSQKIGFKLFCLLIISGFFNSILKDFYHLPRPFQIDSHLMLADVGGYGFPSGAAQGVAIITLFLFSYVKNTTVRTFGVIYALTVSFSRIYLGAHFFTDILMGWYVGALIYFCFNKLYSQIHTKMFPIATGRHLMYASSLFFVLITLWCSPHLLGQFGFVLGTLIGTYLFQIKEHARFSSEKKLFFALITIALFLLMNMGLKKGLVGLQLNALQVASVHFLKGFFLFLSAFITSSCFKQLKIA